MKTGIDGDVPFLFPVVRLKLSFAMDPVPILLRAKWVAPMVPPAILRDGGVVMSGGAIAAVGRADELAARFPSATVHNLGSAVVLPGLVNAHVHLELSHHAPGPTPGRFVDWVMALIRRTAAGDEQTQAMAIADAVRIGVDQCLRFGVTTVGDISRLCGLTRPLLRSQPLRVVSYGEVTAMAQRRGLLEERLAAAADAAEAGPRLRVGISPHAPYSVEPEGYERCRAVAQDRRLPLATHLAETADEAVFLREHAGPLRELWTFLGAWDSRVPHFDGGPIRLMHSLGLLGRPDVLLAHVNYCDDAEMELLAAPGQGASVVYCPRTHAYFGHPPHRWREMLARGINVAVGTDSSASSPDLNLVDDLRLLHRLAGEVPAINLWEMATIRAARAVGMEREVGSLTPGKAADCVVFAVEGDDPLRELLEGEAKPAGVWIGGELMEPNKV
jgi:cytosine/adenosine deaminase-related metal-dependent hydrolase